MKVRVSSRPEKFRRAGMEFTREPRIIDVDKETLKTLQGEPMLAVEVLRDKEKTSGENGSDTDTEPKK